VRSFAAALALALGLVSPAAAQGKTTEPAPVSSSALLLRMRSVNATLDTARDVGFELSDRSITVRAQFFDLLARRYKKALGEFADGRQKLHRRMQKAVPKVQRRLQRKGGAAEVDSLREQCLAITRGKGLTKKRIQEDLDPLMLRLRELTLPKPAQVVDDDEKLAAQIDDLQRERDDLQGWFDLYADTRDALGDEQAGQRHLRKHKPAPEPPPTDLVRTDVARLCLMALPMSGRDKKTLAANDALRATTVAEEFGGTLELNRIRIALGLATLRIDEKLGVAARGHSEDMRTLGFFSHTSPVEGKRTPGDRAARAGTSGGAENIAAGQDTGHGAIRAGWYSPGHHKNMLGSHARTGLGQSERFWTQMFGG